MKTIGYQSNWVSGKEDEIRTGTNRELMALLSASSACPIFIPAEKTWLNAIDPNTWIEFKGDKLGTDCREVGNWYGDGKDNIAVWSMKGWMRQEIGNATMDGRAIELTELGTGIFEIRLFGFGGNGDYQVISWDGRRFVKAD